MCSQLRYSSWSYDDYLNLVLTINNSITYFVPAKIGRPRKEDALKLKAKAVSPQPVSRAGGRIKVNSCYTSTLAKPTRISFQKPKVVYDPSDNNLSKKLRREQDNNSMTKFDSDSSSPEAYHVKKIPAQKSAIRESITKKEPEEQCSICSKYEIKRDKLLIFCVDCNYRGERKKFMFLLLRNFTKYQLFRKFFFYFIQIQNEGLQYFCLDSTKFFC